jgi:NOL1/NOP2/fmu family ribosome biogenesis protein
MKFLNSKQKKLIKEGLKETYGITELKDYLLIEFGKKRLRAFSGNLTREEISQLSQITNIELIGMYLINQKDDDLRLNFDAVSLLRDQITKNVLEIDKKHLEMWFRGYDLELKCPRGIIVLKFQAELVGIGKSNTEKIFNYVPKERKLRTPIPKSPIPKE